MRWYPWYHAQRVKARSVAWRRGSSQEKIETLEAKRQREGPESYSACEWNYAHRFIFGSIFRLQHLKFLRRNFSSSKSDFGCLVTNHRRVDSFNKLASLACMSNYFSFSLIFREITHDTLQEDLNTTVSNRKGKTLLEKVQQLTIFLSSVNVLLLCLSNLSSPLKVLFF